MMESPSDNRPLKLAKAEAPEAGHRVVEIANGKLRGAVQDGIVSFKGVHYGQPTTGRNRFRPAQPVMPWPGIRDATQLGSPCPQDNLKLVAWGDSVPESEDCLVLNVWAPETARPASKLPVMLWIHGGGYSFGSGGARVYDGGRLARDGDVVAVGINHRLHIFGFTDLSEWGGDEFAASGNVGQLDVLAALKWVRENIEAFGGDPDNITLFGQSGGGAKISALMAMPAATGLYKRAIVQSGSVFRYRTRDEALEMSRRMYAILGIAPGDIAALQEVPTDILLNCSFQIMNTSEGIGHPGLAYAPIMESPELPGQPWRTTAPAQGRDIPLMIGTTLTETVFYVSDEHRKLLASGGDVDVVAAIINSVPAYSPSPARVAELVSLYREAMPNLSKLELVVQVSTDLCYWEEAIHQAELQSEAGAPVYFYRCDWRTPCFGGMWSPHGIDIPLIMGIHEYGAAWDGVDTDAARAAADPDNLNGKLSSLMQSAWVNFARSGNPSTPDLTWPRYDAETRATVIFDSDTQIVNDPNAGIRRTLKMV